MTPKSIRLNNLIEYRDALCFVLNLHTTESTRRELMELRDGLKKQIKELCSKEAVI